MNPDGTTLVADWYMKNVGKPWESSPIELWHKYVGHDNNRDWFMFNMPETRNIARQLYVEWFPQIVYNQHQSGPFPSRIFVPPFDDPMNVTIPPLIMRGVNTVGDAMTRRLDQEGKRGAISRVGFDTWWNGGMRTAPYFHNMVGILTETGHASATPADYDPKTFPPTFANGIPTLIPTTYYPSPFMGGHWTMRDSCNIMVTTSMAALDIGAKRREEWLYDIYQLGRDSIKAGENEYFVVPADQWDAGTATKMINVLRWGAIEVDRATAPIQIGSRSYAAGSFVMKGAQPFRPYLVDLMTPQVYPDLRLYPGGPPKRPYDITGWTLPMQMGVSVERVTGALTGPVERVEWATPRTASMPSSAKAAFVLDPRANDSFTIVNRLLKAGDVVSRTTAPIDVNGAQWPAGAFLVNAAQGVVGRVTQAASALGVRVGSIDASPSGDVLKLKAPRIGVYHAWGGNMDEGWTRWLLEQFEFPYTSLHDKDIRAGGLRAKFDVILLPDASYDSMLNGLAPETAPPEYVGGLTAKGVSNLYEFVTSGGTLVAMDRAGELPITAFGLPIRNVTANMREADFFIPGSLLRLRLDPTQPLAYGMQSDAAAFFIRSPAFAVGRERGRGFDGPDSRGVIKPEGVTVTGRYPEKDLLLSGWLLGERVIANQSAIVDAQVEKGRVVLLGFRTQHRAQPHATFKLLFNAIYLGASERGAAPKAATP